MLDRCQPSPNTAIVKSKRLPLRMYTLQVPDPSRTFNFCKAKEPHSSAKFIHFAKTTTGTSHRHLA